MQTRFLFLQTFFGFRTQTRLLFGFETKLFSDALRFGFRLNLLLLQTRFSFITTGYLSFDAQALFFFGFTERKNFRFDSLLLGGETGGLLFGLTAKRLQLTE